MRSETNSPWETETGTRGRPADATSYTTKTTGLRKVRKKPTKSGSISSYNVKILPADKKSISQLMKRSTRLSTKTNSEKIS